MDQKEVEELQEKIWILEALFLEVLNDLPKDVRRDWLARYQLQWELHNVPQVSP